MKNASFQTTVEITFWLACCSIATLSLLPLNELPDITMDIWDKAQHAFGFLCLGVLGLWAYPKHFARVCIGLLLFGAAIEFAQTASGWRTGDPLDWVADAVGTALAATGFRLSKRSTK